MDDSPHKNLLNDPFNVVHPHAFGIDHESFPHYCLLTTLGPHLFRMKCSGEFCPSIYNGRCDEGGDEAIVPQIRIVLA